MEPQEYSRKIVECKDPGRDIPTIFSGFPVKSLHVSITPTLARLVYGASCQENLP